jgi:chromosome partitioning protein
MDCPPSLGLLAVNALVAATAMLIPMQAEFFALQGLSGLMGVVDLVKKRLNPGLEFLAIVPCMVDARRNLSTEVLAEVQGHFGDRVSTARIRTNVRLAEAPSHGLSIFDYDPESNGAADYMNLADDLLARLRIQSADR